MAFKQKGYPMHKGTASHREASAAFQKTTTMVGGQAEQNTSRGRGQEDES